MELPTGSRIVAALRLGSIPTPARGTRSPPGRVLSRHPLPALGLLAKAAARGASRVGCPNGSISTSQPTLVLTPTTPAELHQLFLKVRLCWAGLSGHITPRLTLGLPLVRALRASYRRGRWFESTTANSNSVGLSITRTGRFVRSAVINVAAVGNPGDDGIRPRSSGSLRPELNETFGRSGLPQIDHWN